MDDRCRFLPQYLYTGVNVHLQVDSRLPNQYLSNYMCEKKFTPQGVCHN